MSGMSASSGRLITGVEHIEQSIGDILSTPLGSRVMRRDYGSLLPELIDQPMNEATLLRAYAATILAIGRWEPRVEVTAIRRIVDLDAPGVTFEIEGYTKDGALRVEVEL